MRIVHVSDCYVPRLGGIERQVHELATRQRLQGHEVRVVTSVAAAVDAPGADEAMVIRPERRGAPGRIHYTASWSGRRRALRAPADVLHVHASTWSPMAYLTLAAAARSGIPAVVTVHSLWDYAEPAFTTADHVLRWRRWPVVWSAVSTVAARELGRVLGGGPDVAVLANGVDAEDWRPAAPRPAAGGGTLTLISVGRLAERKRPRQLLRMLQQLRSAVGPDVRLEANLVGDGPLRNRLERHLHRHGMADWVRLSGRADRAQLRAALHAADVYVAPARLESFGIAALEARCAGLPVVAYAASGVADFIGDGREGLLVGSDAEMVAAMARLIDDPALRGRMSQHNAETVPSISWPRVLLQCDALYARARAMRGLPAADAGLVPTA